MLKKNHFYYYLPEHCIHVNLLPSRSENCLEARAKPGAGMASIFGATTATPSNVLLQMKAGKMAQNGTTVTPDARKGLMVLCKTEDGLMHLIWQDRATGTVEDDLIVFQGDATLKHVPQCKTGFAMMLAFTTGRKALFWSQESRKKGLDWEDVTKETELIKKANDILNGIPAPAAAAPTGACPHRAALPCCRPSSARRDEHPSLPSPTCIPPPPAHLPFRLFRSFSRRLWRHDPFGVDGDALWRRRGQRRSAGCRRARRSRRYRRHSFG